MALAAIKAFHHRKGLASPTNHPSIALSLAGMKRLHGKHATQAKPMTKGVLRQLLRSTFGHNRAFPPSIPLRLWRAMWFELVAFFTCSRYSDIAKLTRRHIHVSLMEVRITFASRKNDQAGSGHFAIIKATNGSFCPVAFTKQYLELIPNESMAPLLPSLNVAHPTLPATYNAMRKGQQSLLQTIGFYPCPFGLHSGRVGGSIALHNAGWSWQDIGAFGGWSPNSFMPYRYCQRATARKRQMSGGLAL